MQNTAKFKAHLLGPSLYLMHTGVVTGSLLLQGACRRASRITLLGAAPHTTFLLLGAWESKVSCHTCQDRTLIHGHHQFIIQILVLLSSCTQLTWQACFSFMLLGQSDVSDVTVCYICQRLNDDGQAGLTVVVQVFWDVAVWGWLSSSEYL